MREVKFRGKHVDDGEWLYGCLSYVDSRSQKIGSDFGNSFICQVQHSWQKTDSGYNIGWWIQAETKTVGQFTGLHDKNGVEIYEGDIVEAWSQGVKAKGEIKQRIDGTWIMYPSWQNSEMWYLMPNDIGETTVEVIGNIHEVEENET